MSKEITTISVPFIFNFTVNCHLLPARDGYVLIDTGRNNKRAVVEEGLERAGCRPGDLKLIFLTHGDFDHTGNAAYLREKFGTQVGMHPDDAGMVEHGSMLWNRKKTLLSRIMLGSLFRLRAADRFKPDVTLEPGSDLSAYGLGAQVIHLPGHSRGSIGLLTADGVLFCGDLLGNLGKPEVWSIIDDAEAMQASVRKLKDYDVKTVYPGHGKPFPMEAFQKSGGGK